MLTILRGRLPVDQVEKLSTSLNVESLDIDVDIDRFNPAQEFPPEKEKPSSVPPDPDTPLSHPYLPQKDMDIVDFQVGHPTYDGRGVGMAILDATPDMLVPELQRATSLDGQPIRKISELLASTDPRDDIDPCGDGEAGPRRRRQIHRRQCDLTLSLARRRISLRQF